MSGIIGRLGDLLNSGIALATNKKPVQMTTKQTITVTEYTEAVNERGTAFYPRKSVTTKETVESVFRDGDMKLTGWQTTTTYNIQGKVTSVLKERLDK